MFSRGYLYRGCLWFCSASLSCQCHVVSSFLLETSKPYGYMSPFLNTWQRNKVKDTVNTTHSLVSLTHCRIDILCAQQHGPTQSLLHCNVGWKLQMPQRTLWVYFHLDRCHCRLSHLQHVFFWHVLSASVTGRRPCPFTGFGLLYVLVAGGSIKRCV